MNQLDLNTNEIGSPKLFEQTVGELLSLSGFDVYSERILGHKKADLYMEEKRLGSTRKIAGECKCYNKPRTQDELTRISANYFSLYESKIIDELLVITLKGLTPSAYTMIDHSRFLNHLTYNELQRSVLDFRAYLRGLIDLYKRDGLSHYYVNLKTSNDLDLESIILDWIVDPLADYPVAILGSYGIGKTTFAKRLSYILAENALTNESDNRIPILLRLGDISSEQSLDGLLGKTFTSISVVRNYNFNIFMKLNELGRFVILLDGFDEMKHSLTWEEFKYNFRQINRLVVPGSKIILLGRPTAFFNDEEQNFALHGKKYLDDQMIRDPDWPDYSELYVSLFNREQVKKFLYNYLEYKKSTLSSPSEKRKLDNVIKNKIDQISSKQFTDIARRPVQLRMLAEVLPQWQKDISLLTVSILYDYFIDLMIEREQQKLARRLFGVKERRKFSRQLARWLWENKKEMSITGEIIPESIFYEYCYGEKDERTLEGVRRDLISACFLDRKIGGSLYFPHRSFQEFLVAESIVEDLTVKKISFSLADALLTEEISYFLEGLVNVQVFTKWENEFEKYRGKLSWKFLKIWISEKNYLNYLISRINHSNSPWYPLLLAIAAYSGKYPARDLGEILLEKQKSDDILFSLQCFLCISGLQVDSLMSKSLALLCNHPSHWKLIIDENKKKQKVFQPDEIIIKFISRLQGGIKRDLIDLRGIYTYLRKSLDEYCIVSDWILGNTLKTESLYQPQEVWLSIDDADVVRSFSGKYCLDLGS